MKNNTNQKEIPKEIKFFSKVFFVIGVLLILYPIISFIYANLTATNAFSRDFSFIFIIFGLIIYFPLAAVPFLVSVELKQRKPWARALGIIILVFTFLIGILAIADSDFYFFFSYLNNLFGIFISTLSIVGICFLLINKRVSRFFQDN